MAQWHSKGWGHGTPPLVKGQAEGQTLHPSTKPLEKLTRSKNMGKQGQLNKRYWNIVTYGDIYVIYDMLARTKNVKSFWTIKHDKDVNEDGEIKPEHIHIVLELYDRRYTNTVRNMLYRVDEKGKPITVMVQPCEDVKNAIDYLTHKNQPEKMPYSDDAVLRFGRLDETEESDNEYYKMVIAIKQNEVTPLEALRRYGDKFIKNVKNISFILRWEKNVNDLRKIADSNENYRALIKTERE